MKIQMVAVSIQVLAAIPTFLMKIGSGSDYEHSSSSESSESVESDIVDTDVDDEKSEQGDSGVTIGKQLSQVWIHPNIKTGLIIWQRLASQRREMK